MVQFGEFLKTWSLRSISITRHVSFNRTKIGGKCQNWKTQMRHIGWFSNTVLDQWSRINFISEAFQFADWIDFNQDWKLRSNWERQPSAASQQRMQLGSQGTGLRCLGAPLLWQLKQLSQRGSRRESGEASLRNAKWISIGKLRLSHRQIRQKKKN